MTDPAPSSTATAEPPVVPPVATPPVATPPAAPAPAATPEVPPAAPPPAATTVVPPPAETKTDKPPMSEADKLAVPEGALLTKDYVAQFQKDAIAAGLSKDEAQDLLNTQINAVKDYDVRTKESVENAKKQWAEMSRSDTEIGGDNFNRTAEISKRVVDKFGNDEFKKLLSETGFGNYPAVLKFLSKVGGAFSEDQLRPGNPSSGGQTKSREDILFSGSTAGK